MGWNLGFIAFDHEPALGGVEWLWAYRLFKRSDRNEWYVDGLSDIANGAILLERPQLALPHDSALWRDAASEISRLRAELARLGAKEFGYDYNLLPISLVLSAALQERLLVVGGDNQFVDCGFICSNGRLAQARVLVGEERALTFDWEKPSSIVQLNWSEGRLLYELGSSVAAEFFGEADAAAFATHWHERTPGEYDLIAERAGRPRERVQLWPFVALSVVLLGFAIFLDKNPQLMMPVGIAALALGLVWYFWPQRK